MQPTSIFMSLVLMALAGSERLGSSVLDDLEKARQQYRRLCTSCSRTTTPR